MEIYARMILVRRLPGGIWHWLGRATLYTATTSVRTKVVLFGNLMEWGMLILIAGSISVIELVAVPISARVLLSVLLIGGAMALAFTWQPRTRALWLCLAEAILWIFLYGVSWLIGGIILYLVAHAAGANQLDWAKAVGVWTLAGGAEHDHYDCAGCDRGPGSISGVPPATLPSCIRRPACCAGVDVCSSRCRMLLWGLTGWAIAALALRKRTVPSDALH